MAIKHDQEMKMQSTMETGTVPKTDGHMTKTKQQEAGNENYSQILLEDYKAVVMLDVKMQLKGAE